MAQEFGGRPEDRIRDDEGDTLTRITVEFYPSQADVEFKTNSRGTTFVPANGVWTFTDPDLAELWIAPVGGPYFTPYQVRSKTHLDSAFAAATGPLQDALATTRRRTGAYITRQSDGLSGFSSTAGMSVSGAYLAATVGGTNGDAIVPLFAKQARASFRVKCTKATAGSRATVGIAVSSPGVLPTAGNYTFTFGYKAGSGLCWVRDNVGGDTVVVADSAITDGDEYDVTMLIDNAMSPRGGSPAQAEVDVRYRKVGTVGTDGWSNVALNVANFNPGNLLVRTNVAASGLSLVSTAIPAVGALPDAVLPSVSQLQYVYGTSGYENIMVHAPVTPNGMAVIVSHGHGDSNNSAGWTSTKHRAVWDALTKAGYYVFVPNQAGNLWGNDTVLSALKGLHSSIVDDFGLDPRVFLWGDSMGGGATLTAIAKGTVPVRAAYITEPVCDLSLLWSNPSFTTLPAAYNNSAAERDDNNPMTQPASAFAGVPIAFCASTGDSTIPKAQHTDAMRAKLAGVTETALFTTTGAHAGVDAYRPIDPVIWFAAHV